MHATHYAMAYVIVDTCTKDGLCIETCPMDCIHPKPDEPEFNTVPQLYVDPEQCVDCGACVPVCPTDSMFILDDLPPEKAVFAERNAAYYKH